MENREKLRRIEFKEKPSSKIETGYFHEWGKEAIEDNEGSIEEYSIGIVENEEGNIKNVYPPLIKFLS